MFTKMKTVKVDPIKQDEDSISQEESQERIFKVPTYIMAFCFHALYIIQKFKKILNFKTEFNPIHIFATARNLNKQFSGDTFLLLYSRQILY